MWREAGGRGGAGAAPAGHHGLTTRASARVRTECAVIMVYANDVSHSEQGSASGLGPAPGSDHTGFNEVGRGRGGRRAQWIVVRARRPRRTLGRLGRQSGVPLLLPTAAANAWPRRPALLSRARSITGMTDTRGSLTLTAAAALQGRPPPADAAASSGQDSSRRGSPRQCVLGWLPSCSHRGGVHPCRMPVALELESHSVRRACVRVVAAHHRHSTIES